MPSPPIPLCSCSRPQFLQSCAMEAYRALGIAHDQAVHILTHGQSMVEDWSRLDGLPCDGGDQDAWVREIFAVLIAVGVLECPVMADDELSR